MKYIIINIIFLNYFLNIKKREKYKKNEIYYN